MIHEPLLELEGPIHRLRRDPLSLPKVEQGPESAIPKGCSTSYGTWVYSKPYCYARPNGYWVCS